MHKPATSNILHIAKNARSSCTSEVATSSTLLSSVRTAVWSATTAGETQVRFAKKQTIQRLLVSWPFVCRHFLQHEEKKKATWGTIFFSCYFSEHACLAEAHPMHTWPVSTFLERSDVCELHPRTSTGPASVENEKKRASDRLDTERVTRAVLSTYSALIEKSSVHCMHAMQQKLKTRLKLLRGGRAPTAPPPPPWIRLCAHLCYNPTTIKVLKQSLTMAIMEP